MKIMMIKIVIKMFMRMIKKQSIRIKKIMKKINERIMIKMIMIMKKEHSIMIKITIIR